MGEIEASNARNNTKMAKRNRRARRRTDAKAPVPSPETTQARSPQDQEDVDGFLVQIRKRELTIAGEQPGSIQKLPGYEISVAIPDWDKNRDLLRSVEKGHLAQQKLLTQLQGDGASRPWMAQRFAEMDKTVAVALTTIAERIRTRRWREKEHREAFQRLQDAFRDLKRWTEKTTRYCRCAENCTDPEEKETVLDAACLGILKVGELINQVERMQHGFWNEFSAANFLEVRHMRNLIGHTSDLEHEDVIPLGTGIVQDLHTAVQRTLFPEAGGPVTGGFMMHTSLVRELEPSRPGEKVTPSNSIAMIRADDHGRFIVYRVGRSEENTLLISSSATGPMQLSVHGFRSDPRIADGSAELRPRSC